MRRKREYKQARKMGATWRRYWHGKRSSGSIGKWLGRVFVTTIAHDKTDLVRYLGGVLIDGAADTTASYLQSLILALLAYPDAQRKAQEEIDRVVGQHRMPTPEDLDEMPYIRAIILEVGSSAPFHDISNDFV
jgi:cytochrome P450